MYLSLFYTAVILSLHIHFQIRHLGLEDAMTACKDLGNGWKVTRKTSGSIVCSKVSYLKHCQKCDVWRLYVWEDGACDKLQKSRCTRNKTKAGKYYCGYEPCRNGVLQYGGEWFESSSSSGSSNEPGEKKPNNMNHGISQEYFPNPVSSLFPFITI